MISIMKERTIRYLQGDPEIDEKKLGIDPEREHLLLMNLFTSGNYAHAGGQDWHDANKIRIDDAREEFELMKEYNYIHSGFKKSAEKDDREKPVRHFDLKATINRDESISVVMTEQGNKHTFVFTKEAIAGFYHDHPIHGRYVIANMFGIFKKAQNSIRCMPIGEKQLILNDKLKETITAVYKDTKELPDSEGITEWSFVSTTESGVDAINFAYGDEVRYCAFIEAFTAALFDGTRGGCYEWLYKEICYGAA